MNREIKIHNFCLCILIKQSSEATLGLPFGETFDVNSSRFVSLYGFQKLLSLLQCFMPRKTTVEKIDSIILQQFRTLTSIEIILIHSRHIHREFGIFSFETSTASSLIHQEEVSFSTYKTIRLIAINYSM